MRELPPTKLLEAIVDHTVGDLYGRSAHCAGTSVTFTRFAISTYEEERKCSNECVLSKTKEGDGTRAHTTACVCCDDVSSVLTVATDGSRRIRPSTTKFPVYRCMRDWWSPDFLIGPVALPVLIELKTSGADQPPHFDLQARDRHDFSKL